jgi:hypothetical protein
VGEVSFPGLSDGYWYFRVRAVALDEQGEPTGDWGPMATFFVWVDHVPRITEIWSPTHPEQWSWYAARTAAFEWRSTPEAGDCGYSFVVDQSSYTEPDQAVDTDETKATVENLPLGTSWLHVRAVDAEGNWGPAEHFQVQVKQGPVTMALPYKTTRTGVIWLQYSVSDAMSGECYVSIDIRSARGKLVRTMEIGWKQINMAFTAVVDPQLAKGKYTYTVHAHDWWGITESKAGTATFIVR